MNRSSIPQQVNPRSMAPKKKPAPKPAPKPYPKSR